MRNILVVVGSGNVHGNTNKLCDAFIQGVQEAGHHVKKVNLNKNIQGCLGCLSCQKNGGHCVINDAMQPLYDEFIQADTIVLASPLYFWSISSRLKSFIDRLYAISKEDMYPYKETALIMSAGDDGFYTFEQAVSFYRFFVNALGWKDKGMVLAKGCEENSVPELSIQEAYELGKSLI